MVFLPLDASVTQMTANGCLDQCDGSGAGGVPERREYTEG